MRSLSSQYFEQPFLKKDLFLIENVQSHVMKIVISIRNLSYEEVMKILLYPIPMLKYRPGRNDVIQVYKIMHSINKCNIGCEYIF